MSARRFKSSSLLEFNIKQYLERELVNAGFYFNVASGSVDVNANRQDVLRRVDGNTYESFTNKWVAETDATGCAGFNTIDPSGVVIDGVFHAKGAAPHQPAFDFDNGRVIFEGTAVSSSATVSAEFSYKQVSVDLPDSNIVNQVFSLIRDNVDFTPNSFPSGNQKQFPLVVIDLQNTIMTPGELGGGKNKSQLITLHVLSNDRNELNGITDFLEELSFRKTIQGVDFNIAPQQFLQNGDRASTYVNYTDMQASGALAWQKIFVDQTRVRERDTNYNILRNRVDWTINLLFLPPTGG